MSAKETPLNHFLRQCGLDVVEVEQMVLGAMRRVPHFRHNHPPVQNVNDQVLESFTIAASEKSFWKAVQTPESLTKRLGASLHEFLTRVMLHAASLTTAQDVAWLLASYARDAKARVEDLKGIYRKAYGSELGS